uniref:sphingosine kinase n=1 Tax=Oncorhynchus tshawytscha TaxID=74940 RepID=A0A8C8IJW9_ONCTS
MRSPEPPIPSPAEALLHCQFGGWGTGSSCNNSCPNSPGGPGGLSSPSPSPSPSPASSYALTLTPSHIHVQRLAPRPGKEARLILPLSELAGCSCPRAPAPPLLVLYWYPPGRRRKGVSRRRQVRVYLAEARVEAERWSTAIQCLLRGVAITADTEIVKRLLPRPRRLLLLVNPFSGRGQAMQWCQTHILPMIREANISYNLIQTERQNHARELIKEISLPQWDGIIIVSGDGLLHEVINGLMERPDWELAIKTPVGILPCGSGNALAGSINHHAGYDMCLREPLLLNCCFQLCRGGVKPMDLVSVTTSPTPSQNGRPSLPRRMFSFLSVAWGFVSDVDIESERYRGLGSARFTLGTLVRLASLRSYKGRLSYLPPSIVATSPDAIPPPLRRPLSRSITEGLEGFCHTPIQRTSSDMGLSEQRSLRRVDTEREREREMERQRERERRRERARGGGTGVVRASSLAEDREREMEGEAGRSGTSSERSGTSSESNEREDCRMGREDEMTGNMEERPDEERENGTMEQDSGVIEDIEERVRNGEGSSGSMDGVMEAKEVGEGYGGDMGREANEDPEGYYSYPDNLQQTRLALRKNSAPSSQIANAFFSQPLSQEADPMSGASYRAEEMDLNETYFQKEAYPLDIARERALTISSPFRHSPFSFKPKSLDQNTSRPRPLSLLHHPHSNSLPLNSPPCPSPSLPRPLPPRPVPPPLLLLPCSAPQHPQLHLPVSPVPLLYL